MALLRGAGGGLALAVLSAVTFGLAGSFAKALIDAGWSANGAVLVRLGGGAAVLVVILLVTRPGVIAALRRDTSGLLVYGLLAMALVQLAFFNAVRYLAVPVALLLEYAGPVIVIGWVWLVRRQPPTRRTVLGGLVAVAGLLLVVRIWSAESISWPGVAWGLLAACCQASYFLIADRAHSGGNATPPLVLAGVGMVIGTLAVAGFGWTGLLPVHVDPAATRVLLAGVDVGWPVAAGLLVLVATVVAYLSGILAIRRIGATRGALVGLLEVVAAALAAWLLLDQVPAPVQILGGLLLLTGIALTQTGARPPAPEPAAAASTTG
ncbi:EamA family transporter [Pseudonocardia eucalypti]|uniref:EamA family transporter n=1 Tax=Pseudonocardia eucalypti TaxID=648755 RepID=A0ABP9R0T1_9PSEU|nr:drug/metabolite transporter (DMT)-like permease [Pseudonocardia eucalypti]